ncbi:hypothetical protein [Mesorhizobium sp.]|uniref:hypothetical protein n=1 Tax=Mesorhizobium sp. TaxID=1871066 RepID=UPI000FE49613|nr:hypothetical protein [Mesorhizobium sp.]RWD72311.1 MAG: hypothetical protein EOS37_08600 [Mesorhizobium sp.]TIV58864.1 MAG: hypothetical protein E5V80_16535 [Mesorhizobium sp.]
MFLFDRRAGVPLLRAESIVFLCFTALKMAQQLAWNVQTPHQLLKVYLSFLLVFLVSRRWPAPQTEIQANGKPQMGKPK